MAGKSLMLRDGRVCGWLWVRDVPESPRREFGAGGRSTGKGTSSSWGWQAAAGWRVLGLDLTQMGRKA